MSCEKTVDDQTEFEFYQQRLGKTILDCCGPLVTIGFTQASYEVFNLAMADAEMSDDYLDRYDPQLLDSSYVGLTMCSKHWIHHAQLVATLGKHQEIFLFEQLGYYIFSVVCLVNTWDYKEVINYSKTM